VNVSQGLQDGAEVVDDEMNDGESQSADKMEVDE